jgi:CBS domain containing-hemolysin-like protein
MLKNLLIFCIALFIPFIFFRTALYIISKPIEELSLHTREGLKFHHLHYGIMLLVVGILALLILGVTTFSIVLAGLGLGTILDEYLASLYIPEQEPAVTILYRKSFYPTLLILASTILLILLLGAIIYR